MEIKSLRNFAIRGRLFEGVVTSSLMTNTCKVNITRLVYNRLLKKTLRENSILFAYIPSEFQNLVVGNTVRIGETRKLSKRCSFVIYEILSTPDTTSSNE